MRRVVRMFPWVAGLGGFFVGATLSFLVLEVGLGSSGAGGSKLSVVIALAPAILAFDLTGRITDRLFPSPKGI